MSANNHVNGSIGDPGNDIRTFGTPVHEVGVRPATSEQRNPNTANRIISTVVEEALSTGFARRCAQRWFQAGILKEINRAEEVLLRKDLCRRHHGPLIAALHRGEQRRHGNDRLTGPDLTLEQAMHRMGSHHVRLNLSDRPFLGSREGVGQNAGERINGRTGRVMPDTGG
ncbi:hypothetical protein BMS3Bbin02_00459 [bacterium BMS3Bbin02]|nr:hypothetical protein BMS3Bbin02_00459 [bacterium BMS3Bbin02]